MQDPKSENFAARFKQVNLVSKSDIAYFVKKTDFHNKLKDIRSKKNKKTRKTKN